jgi:hypothetical protein
VTDTLAAVVRGEPHWNLLPREISPTIAVFLRRALQKDPKQRLADIGDMRNAMEGAFDLPAPAAAVPRQRWRSRLPWIAAIAAAAVLASILGWSIKPTAPASVVKLPFVLPEGQGLGSEVSMMTISPDGTRIAYTSNALYLRDLNEAETRRMPGIDGVLTRRPVADLHGRQPW